MNCKTFLLGLLSLAFLPTASATFPDVTEETKYQSAIEYLAERGIVNGYANGNFGPDNTLTRAELLKILLEAKADFVLPPPPTTSCFPDVALTAWYAPYVCHAKDAGIVQGFPDGTMRPDKSVSKAEAVKLLVESRGYTLGGVSSIEEAFADVDATQWYAPYVQFLFNADLLPEKDSGAGVFAPAQAITRSLIAEYLHRTLLKEERRRTPYQIGTPITISAEGYEQIKDLVVPIREFYYGDYWLELTDEDLQKIPEGVQYKIEEDAFDIGGVDPLLDTLDIPVELQAVEVGADEKGLYLMQYIAKSKNEWVIATMDMGIEELGFFGGTNYLVWATPNQIKSAEEQFDFIRAVVPFHGKYKIQPHLLELTGSINWVDVKYYREGADGQQQTADAITALGGEVIHNDIWDDSGYPGGIIAVIIDADRLSDLARLPQVISLSKRVPDSTL